MDILSTMNSGDFKKSTSKKTKLQASQVLSLGVESAPWFCVRSRRFARVQVPARGRGVIFSLLVFLFLSRSASASDWTATDTALQATYIAATVLDWMQTNWVARHSDEFHEVEAAQFIGRYPSVSRVNTYFPSMIAINTLAAIILHRPYRTGFQLYFIGNELRAVDKNHSLGIGMQWRY